MSFIAGGFPKRILNVYFPDTAAAALPITAVGYNSTSSPPLPVNKNFLDVPAHGPGDVIVWIARADNALGLPGLPAGFTDIINSGTPTFLFRSRVAWIVDVVGNINQIQSNAVEWQAVGVYSNVTGIGDSAKTPEQTLANNVLTPVPALTISAPSSWVAVMPMANQTGAVDPQWASTASLTIRRQSFTTQGGGAKGYYDTAAAVAAWPATDVSWLPNVARVTETFAIELLN